MLGPRCSVGLAKQVVGQKVRSWMLVQSAPSDVAPNNRQQGTEQPHTIIYYTILYINILQYTIIYLSCFAPALWGPWPGLLAICRARVQVCTALDWSCYDQFTCRLRKDVLHNPKRSDLWDLLF